MSESEVYRRAFAEYQTARERVREVVEIVRDIADLLKEPQRFQFKNAPGSGTNPAMGPSPTARPLCLAFSYETRPPGQSSLA
jgi:uncharacterized protein (DUF362 family)